MPSSPRAKSRDPFRSKVSRAWLAGLLLICLTASALLAGEGVVRDSQGKPLAGLQVHVYKSAEISPDQLAERLVTGEQGTFTWQGTYQAPVVLEIRGEQGDGRVRWDPRQETEGPDITYPVTETIVLLHDNDQHFDFNLPEAFQARVQAYRQEFDDVFLLNAGDIFTRHAHRWEEDGTSYVDDTDWYRQRALRIVEIMNRIGYDVMTLGNHELDHIATHTREALSSAKFPLLAANLELSTDKLPPVKTHHVLRTGTGREICLLGLTTGQGEGVRVLKPAETVKKHADLKTKHDLLIALTHIGYNADHKLAEQFPMFDAIIGAHSHTLLKEAVLVNGVLIAQAGGCPHQVSSKHPKYLGIVTLVLENGQLIEKRGEVLQIPQPQAVPVP